MKVGDLFKVSRGNCDGAETYNKGGVPLVAAGTDNVGVVALITGGSKDKLFKSVPCLTIPAVGQGGSMFVSVQTKNFYATKNVAVLIPNENPLWGHNKHGLLIAISAFLRKQRWRFYYMRPCGSRLADLDLDMPLIQTISAAITQSKPKIKTITQSDVASLLAKLPKGVAIKDLFDMVKRNTFENSEARESGAVPLVSASSNNNAVVGFVDTQSPKDIVPGNTISVAKDGVPMIARVQVNPYAMNTHVIPLQAKAAAKFTDKELAILAALIENQGWRYNYMRAAAWGRMGPQVIT